MITNKVLFGHLMFVTAATLTGCQQDASVMPAPVEIASPAAPGSRSPNIATGPDGSIVMSWLSPAGESHALQYSLLDSATWSPGKRLTTGSNWFVNWADFPSVVPLSDSLWAAHWLVSQEAGGYAYDINLAISRDAGATWTDPFVPHDDNTPTEHGFVTLFNDDGDLGALWLDGRKMVNEFDIDDIASSGMTLRSGTFSPDREQLTASLVDDLTCDCCQTDVALTPAGPVAVYRDRTTSEQRDIYVARREQGRWLPGVAVNDDRWDIAACPVNGPVIVASGHQVAVAWFTGAGGMPLVNAAWSQDSGQEFSAPITIDSQQPLGHVGAVMTESGDLVVTWIRSNGAGGGHLMLKRVSANGARSESYQLTMADDILAFSVPQLAIAGNSIVIAWTSGQTDAGGIRTAAVPLQVLGPLSD